MTTIRFAGWFKVGADHHRAEFVVTGDPRLPDGSQVHCDTLRALKLPFHPFPSYWEWTRERFGRMLQIRKMLKDFPSLPI